MGIDGGGDGKPAEYVLLKASGKRVRLKSKGTYFANSGDILRILTPGGGGYGRPSEKPKEATLEDVLDGKISKKRAHAEYGFRLSR